MVKNYLLDADGQDFAAANSPQIFILICVHLGNLSPIRLSDGKNHLDTDQHGW
jgi:hypothetical protein